MQICPELANQVKEIQLSGSACASASKRLVEGGVEGGWTGYDIQPTQAGQCSLEVFFDDGTTFSSNAPPSALEILQGPGCCSGLYPDPLSAADIRVCPLPEGGLDAGAPRDGGAGS